MEITLAPQAGRFSNNNLDEKGLALLEQYGASLFLDAVSVSRFARAFRYRASTSRADGDDFWDEVELTLQKSDPIGIAKDTLVRQVQ
jgi:hypothetical protein